MTWATPTTKTQMYTVLKQIYYYYRIRRPEHQQLNVTALSIPRISFTPLTDSELLAKAGNVLDGTFKREIYTKSESLKTEKENYQKELTELNTTYTDLIAKINETYDEKKLKLNNEGVKKGVINSTLMQDKILALESERLQKIAEKNTEKASKVTSINAKIAQLTTRIANISTEFSTIHNADKLAKKIELADAQDALQREIQKYNNTQHTKEVTYHNQLLEMQATVDLRYAELSEKDYSKSQLVDMGYYTDIVNCASAYYNTLTPLSAFQDIQNETGLIPYLDDFYQDFLYMYRVRAETA